MSGSNCGQLGPNLPIPIPRFHHAIHVALNITALSLISIVPRLFMLEIWMGKMMKMHPLGVQLLQILIAILMMMWPLGLPFSLIVAQGTLIKRDSWMRMESLSGALCIEFPMPNMYPDSGSGFNRSQIGFLWGPRFAYLMGGFLIMMTFPLNSRASLKGNMNSLQVVEKTG